MPDYVIDTNVLLRAIDPNSPVHVIARKSIANLLRNGCSVYITPQIVVEFWSVATRSIDKNGCGIDVPLTEHKARALLTAFKMLNEKPESLGIWLTLVSKYQIKGRRVHDTRIVASMLTHNVTHLITFNVNDFKDFQEIRVSHPSAITPASPA